MYRTAKNLACALGIGLWCVAAPAMATTITTTSIASWKADLTNSPTDVSIPGSGTYNTAAGVTLGGFNFVGTVNSTYKLSGTSYSGNPGLIGGSGGSITVNTPAAGENAILIFADATGSGSLTLVLSDGESFAIGNGTFGFVLSQTITSFTLSASGTSQPFVYDVSYGNSDLPQDSPASEAATFGLMGSGLLLVFSAGRKWLKTR